MLKLGTMIILKGENHEFVGLVVKNNNNLWFSPLKKYFIKWNNGYAEWYTEEFIKNTTEQYVIN